MTTEPGDALVLGRPRHRARTAGCALLAIGGAALASIGAPAEQTIGLASAVVFVLVAVLLLARPRGNRPVLVLDGDGLHGTALPAGPLPWSRVTGVVERRLHGQRMLTVLVDDPNAVFAGTIQPEVRAALRANLVMFGSPVAIPLRMLPITFERLSTELTRRSPTAPPQTDSRTA